MLFDAYLFVDWSSAAGPSPPNPAPDAVWVGELSTRVEEQYYFRTRDGAVAHVRERLRELVRQRRRVLVGFDFPYGYPRGLAARLGLGGDAPWRAVWDAIADRVTDDAGNVNNRFAAAAVLNGLASGGPGPFWGCPAGAATPALTATMRGLFTFPHPGDPPLARLRTTETAMGPGVQETWKLAGAGSVGGQALVGIPRVRALRDDPALTAVSRVWPFETGFGTDACPAAGPFVLHAEIWPGIVSPAEIAAETAATDPPGIRDEVQVRLMCRWARDQDAGGGLHTHLSVPGLSGDDRAAARTEEGWILGCPAPLPHG
jgi:hypothetical protein